ncbi:MAG: hypothetical protein A2268_13635 [Candidatus Raymondbacteria bacterium RifOxyA12_full_50_37]|uniref:Uncharacterized protein n=1 Tax=Candidatus Raymondbacteria bacterium RIFOXYD12_FULL_49_13 TaxID=1817890 RepID=A0A1F7F0C1_UNCRA|nr:MAG: hypothetical protein A2248_22810 [Candidatus Raymondbacteria bacterium RIFOXYA2_FULL_49_16]OGJ91855.1 MAG: hypothetical protein A2268_13635 [Candidatus Raymondbacteria bacterium RifOxyA12_full_50_37]OGK00099.1 MAG: hypothetical protein A2519_12800 [Candidatus Raymondbacteria bacterium RIFOXYD12_FULL_49_13]OGK06944.1 MAG: hypothetical protein A2487_11105 [Candidatus Raymondbacteria bacterium RifOxyC12_full_50_8]OGP39657.1 MAG: hypothetical protein A2324_14705 [Candidatus Raymondbacteria 
MVSIILMPMKRIVWNVFRLINTGIIALLVALAMGIGTKPSKDDGNEGPADRPVPEPAPNPEPVEEPQAKQ